MPTPLKKGTLILKDGHRFDGYIFGAEKSSAGETVFSTGMVGYPESLTDPSYRGQLLTFTWPLIGNYGVPKQAKNKQNISTTFESDKIHVKGVIVSEYSQNYSHWNAKESLSDWLKAAGIPGITGIDTRALTKILRTKGSMPGKIVVDGDKTPPDFYDPNLTNLVAEVSPKKVTTYKPEASTYNNPTTVPGRRSSKKFSTTAFHTGSGKTIVMLDCGVKNNTINSFLHRGLTIIRAPWDYDFIDAKIKCDGLFISNGPGDPALLQPTINIIKKAIKLRLPIFGICLGNQLLARAAGATTYKLKFGNRSQNQPCQDTQTGRCYMTTQNHGYSVDPKTLPKDWEVWFTNLNDHTVEGIRHKRLPFMAVQYHPEACPGPVDTNWLFDEFIKTL